MAFFAFCRLALEHTWVATLSIVFLLLVPVPGFFLLGLSLVALLLLRQGMGKALLPCVAGMVTLVTLSAWEMDIDADVPRTALYDVAVLFSIIIAACILRTYGNWAYALCTLSLLLFPVALYDTFISHYWHQSAQLYLALYMQNNIIEAAQIPFWTWSIRQSLPTSLIATAIVGLLIARATQGKLFMPGQFAVDFREIRLPVSMSALFAVLLVACYAFDELVYSYLIIGAPVIVAGISLVHFFVKMRGLRAFWLVFFYISLALGLTTFATMVVALLDSVMNVRKRIMPAASS